MLELPIDDCNQLGEAKHCMYCMALLYRRKIWKLGLIGKCFSGGHIKVHYLICVTWKQGIFYLNGITSWDIQTGSYCSCSVKWLQTCTFIDSQVFGCLVCNSVLNCNAHLTAFTILPWIYTNLKAQYYCCLYTVNSSIKNCITLFLYIFYM